MPVRIGHFVSTEQTIDEQMGTATQLELPLEQTEITFKQYQAIKLRDNLDLIPPSVLAETLGVAEQTLAAWRSDKTGPDFVKLGKQVFYRGEDLCKWIDANVQDVKLGVPGSAEIVPLGTTRPIGG